MKIEFAGEKMVGASVQLRGFTTEGIYDRPLVAAACRTLGRVRNWYLSQDSDGRILASRSIASDEEPTFASLAAEVEAVQAVFSAEIDRLQALHRDLEALGYKREEK